MSIVRNGIADVEFRAGPACPAELRKWDGTYPIVWESWTPPPLDQFAWINGIPGVLREVGGRLVFEMVAPASRWLV
jgi:hypothetical protein